MLTKTILAFTYTATSMFAWPVSKRDECNPEPPTNAFTPKATYNYDVGTGAIYCDPLWNLITKADTDNGHHITTLLTFEYPAATAGKTCQFGFHLAATDVLAGDNGGVIDLFSSLAPAPGCTSSWPPGNQRNVHLGRLKPQLGGDAVFTDKFTTYLTEPTPCPPPGTIEAYELVGVYDNVDVEWQPSVSGPFIAY